MSTKDILGALFLAAAAANFYLAVKVWSMSRAGGSPSEIAVIRAKSQKLNFWSRVTTGVACAVALLFLFLK